MSATERVARIKISLAEIEPVIWRLVEVPAGMRLKALHDVIQASFGWQDYHLYEFAAGDRRYGIPDPDFDIDREVRSARNIKLEALIAQGHTRLGYTYDFGDGWRHDVAIEAVEEGVPGALYPGSSPASSAVRPRTSAAHTAISSFSRRYSTRATRITPA
jgi:hypothetical protein